MTNDSAIFPHVYQTTEFLQTEQRATARELKRRPLGAAKVVNPSHVGIILSIPLPETVIRAVSRRPKTALGQKA